ncbi:hypothetical protein GOBAR_DD34261 [Gossypium barbadense]|nr:hypothetical protein GOBAR_DD34261 [Gossypium barbadense]
MGQIRLVWFLFLCLLGHKGLAKGVLGLACNWGLQSTHPLPPNIVVRLLKDNGFNKVKLFEADTGALKALGRSGIQVMVGIPNDMLASLASAVGNAEAWVKQNVSYYISTHGTDILEKNGFGRMPIVVGEVGWPTDGDPNGNIDNAKRFNQALISRIIQGQGSPKRRTPPDVYIFSLLDEDHKSTLPGNFERHWGIFKYDGSVKYPLDMGNGRALVPAKGVKYLAKQWCVMSPSASSSDPNKLAQSITYACENADCTSLGYGSSCGNLDAQSNASYAFNSYFQTMNQSKEACSFNNLATITNVDPSKPPCRFEIMIDTRKQKAARTPFKSSASKMEGIFAALVVVLGLVICGVH